MSGNATLGALLSEARLSQGMSLRDVERITLGGVSNAYLSQIESGAIKYPSPIILGKLALALCVSYDSLMSAAGYPSSDGYAEELTTLRARLAEVERAQHHWHQKWEAEREKSRRLVECVRKIEQGQIDCWSPKLGEILATVSDLTAAEDEVK